VTEDAEQPAAPEEAESVEETAWWHRDAAERASLGEDPGVGEEGPGQDETTFRRRLEPPSRWPWLVPIISVMSSYALFVRFGEYATTVVVLSQ
jgi:hypothetical protein